MKLLRSKRASAGSVILCLFSLTIALSVVPRPGFAQGVTGITEQGAQFEAMLSGIHSVPPRVTPASGSVAAHLEDMELVVTGSFSGLADEYTASHVHVGRNGVNGPVALPLNPTLDGDSRGGTYEASENTFNLTVEQRDLLLAGALYVNIHSETYPAGEIRGQLLATPNEPPTVSEITSPEDGAHITVTGDGRQTVDLSWTTATDPDGDIVVYLWQLAPDEAFSEVLVTVNTDTVPGFSLTYAQIDELLEDAGLPPGVTIEAHHRVVTSDGSDTTAGPSSMAELTRGEVINILTIAEARAVAPPGEVTVEAVVTRAHGRQTRIQDATGAITLFQSSGSLRDAVNAGNVTDGDLIRVTGTRNDFAMQRQINATSFEVISRNNPLPAPQVVTLAELAANGEAYESALIRVVDLTIDPAGDATFSAGTGSGKSYQISDPTVEPGAVEFRVPNQIDTRIVGKPIPEGRFIYEGVLGRFENMFQLFPVYETDVIPGKQPVWAIAPGDRPWFQNDHSTRGAAFNPVTGNVVIVSRTGGVSVQRLDAYSGSSRGTMDVTGIEGGNPFALNEIAVTCDGQIFAANLTINATAGNLRIYHWANEHSAPQRIFDMALDAQRYGDALAVGGCFDDVQIYISGSLNDRIMRLHWDGESVGEPSYIPVQVGAARLGIGVVPGENALWINGFGTTTRKISTEDGSIIAEIPTTILPAATSVAGYHEFGDLHLLAVGPDAGQQFKLLDVTDVMNPKVIAFFDRLTPNTNDNRTGAATYDTFHNRLVVLSTNDQVASYSIEEFVGEAVFARMQAIHNSADPEAETVDVYVGGQLWRQNFSYQEATPFMSVPAGVELPIHVSPPGAGLDGAVYTSTATLADRERYYAMAVGVLDPAGFAANPDQRSIAFSIDWIEGAEEHADEADEVEIVFYHGVTDLGELMFFAYGPIPVKKESEFTLRYTDVSEEYFAVSADESWPVLVQGEGHIAYYQRDFTGRGGQTAMLVLGGLAAEADENGGVEMIAVFPDGTVMNMPEVNVSSEPGSELPEMFALLGNYPNPFNPSTTISFDLPQNAEVTIELYDVLGRRVMSMPQISLSAGAARSVRVDASSLGSGMYFYRVIAETATERFVDTGKMTLVK